MTKIEQVARAIYAECDRQSPVLGLQGYQRYSGKSILDGAYDIETIARAAIAAMREPSEAMNKAGFPHMFEHVWTDGTPSVWTAMIDAALEKQQQQETSNDME